MMFSVSKLVSAAALFVSAVSAISIHGVPASNTIALGSQLAIYGAGNGPLNLAVLDDGDACGPALEEILNKPAKTVLNVSISGSKYKVGQEIVFLVEETQSTAERWSQPYKIVAGDDDETPASSATTPDTTPTTDSSSDGPGPSDGPSGPGGAANVASGPNDQAGSGAGARAGASVLAVIAALAVAFL